MKPQDFISELRRMCKAYDNTGCDKCPANELFCKANMDDRSAEQFGALYAAVEKWSNAHPINTRQTAFLKLFPNVRLDKDSDAIAILPCTLDAKLKPERCKRFMRTSAWKTPIEDCFKCKNYYWNEKIKE